MKTSKIKVNNRNAIDLLPFCYYFSNLTNYSVGKYLKNPSGSSVNYGRTVFVGIAKEKYEYPAVTFSGNSYIYVVTYEKDENTNTLHLKHSCRPNFYSGAGTLDFLIDKGDYVGFVVDTNPGTVYFQAFPGKGYFMSYWESGEPGNYSGAPSTDISLDDIEENFDYYFSFALFSYRFLEYTMIDNAIFANIEKLFLTVETEQQNIKNEQDAIKLQIQSLKTTSKSIGIIKDTVFNSNTTLTGWENSGFTLTSTGLESPITGGADKIIQYILHSDLDSSCITCVIDASTTFNIYLTRYHRQYPGSGGTIIGYDFINKKCSLYAPTVKGQTPSNVLTSFDIPFDFVAGRYVLSYENYAELGKITIFGSGLIAEFYYDSRTIQSDYIRPHDNYGIVHISGHYNIKLITFSSPLLISPNVLVVGDSIAEADTIRKLEGGGYEHRWVGLLSNDTSVSLWAEGGNNSTHINSDLDTLVSLFKPNKVIYAIGTNDSNFNTWLSNCQAFTTAFENIGAEVIYTTSVLRFSYETEHAKMRNWIKQSGHRYIDFCSAMSVNGQCSEIKTELFLPDNLHPNVAGHLQMYKCVIGSLPDLINN